MEIERPEIFISYAWGEEREEIVDKLYNSLLAKGYNIIRDKVNLSYKGSITSFMDKIGKGKIVVLIISDKYLKSENCMYEIVQIKKNGKFNDRVFPIVLSDANFYKPVNRTSYIGYWETEIQKLNEAMKGITDMSVIGDIQKELENYRGILNTISNIMFLLKDMNTLTPDMHKDNDFSELTKLIDERIKQDFKNERIIPTNINVDLNTWTAITKKNIKGQYVDFLPIVTQEEKIKRINAKLDLNNHQTIKFGFKFTQTDFNPNENRVRSKGTDLVHLTKYSGSENLRITCIKNGEFVIRDLKFTDFFAGTQNSNIISVDCYLTNENICEFYINKHFTIKFTIENDLRQSCYLYVWSDKQHEYTYKIDYKFETNKESSAMSIAKTAHSYDVDLKYKNLLEDRKTNNLLNLKSSSNNLADFGWTYNENEVNPICKVENNKTVGNYLSINNITDRKAIEYNIGKSFNNVSFTFEDFNIKTTLLYIYIALKDKNDINKDKNIWIKFILVIMNHQKLKKETLSILFMLKKMT